MKKYNKGLVYKECSKFNSENLFTKEEARLGSGHTGWGTIGRLRANSPPEGPSTYQNGCVELNTPTCRRGHREAGPSPAAGGSAGQSSPPAERPAGLREEPARTTRPRHRSWTFIPETWSFVSTGNTCAVVLTTSLRRNGQAANKRIVQQLNGRTHYGPARPWDTLSCKNKRGHRQCPGWVSRASRQANEADLKRLHTVCFHLYNILDMTASPSRRTESGW